MQREARCRDSGSGFHKSGSRLDITFKSAVSNLEMDDSPDRIGPDMAPKRSFADKAKGFGRAFTSKYVQACMAQYFFTDSDREGLIGKYDYAFLFKPNLPFMQKSRRAAPFFGLNDRMPVLLALLFGFQHALSMLAGVISPPIIIAGQGGANLSGEQAQYLVSTSLIVCGILSSIQITRFHIYKTPYYIGTVSGATSFSILIVSSVIDANAW